MVRVTRLCVAAAVALCTVIVGVLPVGAATVPVAVTSPARSVTAFSAVLAGDVDPQGIATDWYFEYGTSTSLGSKTPALSAGAGNASMGETATVSSLLPATTYYFRFVATSRNGNSVGSESTFVTSLVAPTVKTEAVSSVGDGAAKLNGSVNPNGLATTAYLVYGTTPSFGARTTAKSIGAGKSAVTVSLPVSGLAEDTPYYYAVVATNSIGTATGATVSFVTTGLPSVLTGSASSITTSSATVSGTLNPQGHATSWYFQYGTSTAYGAKTATKSAGSGQAAVAVKATIAGLSASTVVDVRLVAVNGDGTAYGANLTFTTLGPTLVSSSSTVTYGHSTMLSGTLPNGAADQPVVIYAQRVTDASFVQIATVLTGSGGTWAMAAKPLIETTYRSSWSGEFSAQATVFVQPLLRIRTTGHEQYAATLSAARSFRGHIVQLQRLDRIGWVTIARAKLNRSSSATFRPHLPKGGSRLRVAISPTQAGTGYSASSSRAILARL